MRLKIFALLSCFLAINFIAEAQKVPPAVTPVEKYAPPRLSEPDSWTMVMIPDTQVYVSRRRNNGALDMVFAWIVENAEKLRIQQVVQVGDLVDLNRKLVSDSRGEYQAGYQQWQAISRIFERLDNNLPYIVTTGNHDYGWGSAENRNSELGRYFTIDRNNKWINVIRDIGENAQGDYTLENAAYEFTTPNKQKILIVAIGFAPDDKQLEWAKSVFNNKKYKNHFGIVVTHSYLRSQKHKGRILKENYALNKQGGNAGEAIFQKLVKITPNIRMVLCGHISAPNDWNNCVNYQVSKNDAGKTVHEILFNPQAMAGGWGGNGGDGFIRLMEFNKDMSKIKVRTFSPVFAYSPSTRHLAWHTAPFNKFEIDLEK